MWVYILVIGLLIFLAHLFSAAFEKTKVPDALLLMIIGVVIGPVAGLIVPEDFGVFGGVITTIALIVILFEGGTTLKLSDMRKAALPMMIVSILTFAGSVMLCFAVSYYLLHLTFFPALLTGTILGGTSSAVVIPIIRSVKVKEPVYSVLMIESALTDVLCIIFTFVVIEAATEASFVSTIGIIWSVLSTLLFAALIGVAGGVLWMFLLKWVRAYPNTVFTTLAFIFILYGITEMVGLSGAIAALAFGVTLSNLPTEKKISAGRELVFHSINSREKKFYSEVVFLLKTFFFLYLGISIKFDSYLLYLVGGLMVVLIFALRMPVTRLAFSKDSGKRDVITASVMVPKGLAAAVLAGMPAAAGIAGSDYIQGLVFAVVLLSILFTAVLAPFASRIPLYSAFFKRFREDCPMENSESGVLENKVGDSA